MASAAERWRRRINADAINNVGIYTRISREREHNQTGCARQEAACREAIARQLGPDAVIHVFSDPSISALRRKKRPGFEEMRRWIENGKLPRLWAWHPDRFTRNTREVEDLIDLIGDNCEVNVWTIEAGDYDLHTPTGRMMARIVGAVATHESEHKGHRVSDAMRTVLLNGDRTAGPRPYGYTDYTCMTLVPDEAAALRHCVDEVLAGASLYSVMKELNATGQFTPRGGPWTQSPLRRVITQPLRAGFALVAPEHGSAARVEVKGNWLPIFSREEHAALLDIFNDPRRKTRVSERRNLLGGLVYTPAGVRMDVGHAGASRAYRAPGVAAPCEVLETMVKDAVLEYHDKKPLDKQDGKVGEVAVLREALAKVEVEITGLKEMRMTGALGFSDWRELHEEADARRQAIISRLALTANVTQGIGAMLARPGELRRRVAGPEWTEADWRKVLLQTVERVVVAPAAMVGRGHSLGRNPDRVSVCFR